MEVIFGKINKDFDRDLYWNKITFFSDDKTKKCIVLSSISLEYLMDSNSIDVPNKLTNEELEKWQCFVKDKWYKLGDNIFLKNIYYDSYANTPQGKNDGLIFLKNKL